ncbi:pentatricopeptide repeat-containing protein At4g02750-like [Selaginella moellendorffii]|uniref:pentatricopeptide repeat-containing protein At4g02750-like n=1 Tax=Selaginella moellendorffii TaxID=88036 RepID=UPI000D1CF4B7|nr:pentatricopeptide repeat-containing protein At4g02750-like [Selaginella moellendorffii]|eukprot:XP_024538021.1 pentatricopeptide repeat-containing protein At4g02750-like [Selaginella moellendorffii]
MAKRDKFSWDLLLVACCKNGHFDEAHCDGHLDSAKVVFSKMPARNLVSWTTMLGVLSQLADVESTFEEMITYGRESKRQLASSRRIGDEQRCDGDKIVLRHLIVKEALRLFQEAAVDVAGKNCRASREIPHTLEELQRRLQMPVTGDTMSSRALAQLQHCCVWNAIATGLTQCVLLDETMKILDKIPAWNLATWNTLLTSHSLQGNLTGARRVFHEMPDKNLESRNAMLSTYAQNGHISLARKCSKRCPCAALNPSVQC